jgi:hypothetical protein
MNPTAVIFWKQNRETNFNWKIFIDHFKMPIIIQVDTFFKATINEQFRSIQKILLTSKVV